MAVCCCSRVPALLTASARLVQPARISLLAGCCSCSAGSEATRAQIASWFALAAWPLSSGLSSMRCWAAARAWPSASRAAAWTLYVRTCCCSGSSAMCCRLGWDSAVRAALGWLRLMASSAPRVAAKICWAGRRVHRHLLENACGAWEVLLLVSQVGCAQAQQGSVFRGLAGGGLLEQLLDAGIRGAWQFAQAG